jgi:type IV pilus assembly protein PilC
MPTYSYQARNSEGKIVKGVVEAANETIAGDTLLDRGLEVIVLKEIKRRFWKIPFLERVTAQDFIIFSRQLALLISAHLPLVSALRIVSRQATNKNFQRILQDLAEEVNAGAKLSQALSRFPNVFDNFFINMVRSGETSGRLEEVLTYLADQKEKDFDLMSKIRGALIYPAFIILTMFAIGTILMIFVVPQLANILKESSVSLPFTTQLLISFSSFLQKYWLLLFFFLIILAIFFRFFLRRSTVRVVWDALKLRLPIFGSLFQKIYLVRFGQSLGTLILGGVEVVEALKISAEVVGNAAYHDLILRTAKEVEDGNSLTVLFMKSKLVPPMVSQMLSVGEETGQLTEVLKKLTAFYTREIDNSLTNLVSIIEPLIIIIIGVGVGLIVSAIILPVYKLASQF